ncbi:MAG: hybrid sensor histidine kinase/response regulator [Nannocystaceae bacterium]|nr:hybrid sensor histidine kinase/response regulator [Nannocystaceae bacterium]
MSAAVDVWRVLIVDDEHPFLESTVFALEGLCVCERAVEIETVTSAAAAYGQLQAVGDDHYALILLDVVMETSHAGLELVTRLRDDLQIRNTRVVLCTGQPGFAPAVQVVTSLEVDDYRLKTELSRDTLICIINTAVRSFRNLLSLAEAYRSVQRASLAIATMAVEADVPTVARETARQLVAALPNTRCAAVWSLDRTDGHSPALVACSEETPPPALASAAAAALAEGCSQDAGPCHAYFERTPRRDVVVAVEARGAGRLELDLCRALARVAFASVTSAETADRLTSALRLADLGALAAGVAHEVANPLTYMQTNLDILGGLIESVQPMEPEAREDMLGLLGDIQTGTSRLRAVVDTMLQVTREITAPLELVGLGTAIASALDTLSPEERQRASIDYAGARPGLMAFGSESRFVQIIVNLVRNALQAFRRQASSNRIELLVHQDGDRAILQVRDNGPGIDPAMQSRVFEPLFTTKGSVGTGLGLSLCRLLLRDIDGSISLDSTLGTGTTVRVSLHAPHMTPAGDGETPGTTKLQVAVVDVDAQSQASILAQTGSKRVHNLSSTHWVQELEHVQADLLFLEYGVLARRASAPRSTLETVVQRHPALGIVVLGRSNTALDVGLLPGPDNVHMLPTPLEPSSLRAVLERTRNTSPRGAND